MIAFMTRTAVVAKASIVQEPKYPKVAECQTPVCPSIPMMIYHFAGCRQDQSRACAYRRKYRCTCNENSIASPGARRGGRVADARARGYLRRASRAFCSCSYPPAPIKFPISLFLYVPPCLRVVTESRGPVHHRKPPRAFALCFRQHDTARTRGQIKN